MKPRVGLAIAGAWLAVAGLFAGVAARDQAAGREVWRAARPIVDSLVTAGAAIAGNLSLLTVALAAVLAGLLVWANARRASTSSSAPRWVLIGLAAALCGQAALVLRHPAVGAALWIAGAVAATYGLIQARSGGPAGWRRLTPRQQPFDRRDVFILTGLLLVAALLRFYRLDQIVNYFEGELAPYYAGATDLFGMWLADAGVHGPWAPLHLSVYLPIWLTTHTFGTTVLAVRAGATLVSLAILPLFFAVARRAGGRPAAVLATSFLVLDPMQIGWARSDIHPHASTLWAPLLVCLALFRAGERRRPVDFALLALAMGVSWQTYPSGQIAVLIPPVAFAAAYLARSPRVRRLRLKPVLATVAGLALWIMMIPLPWLIAQHRWHFPNLIHELGNRTAWDVRPVDSAFGLLSQVARLAATNTAELLAGLFYRVPVLFHQTFLPTVPGFLTRSINWVALPLALFGVAAAICIPTLRRARVVAIWAAVAATPSIFSAVGYVKRAATLYPALLVLAGVGFSVLWQWSTGGRRALRAAAIVTAATALIGLASVQSFLWFSETVYPADTPAIEVSLRSLRPFLEPGTIVILDPSHAYLPGMATYLMLDTLEEPGRYPVAWVPRGENVASFPELLADPTVGLRSLDVTPWYTWTKLRPLRSRLTAEQGWRRAVFLFQTVVHEEAQPQTLADLQATLDRYPEARVSRLPGRDADYRLTVVEVDLPGAADAETVQASTDGRPMESSMTSRRARGATVSSAPLRTRPIGVPLASSDDTTTRAGAPSRSAPAIAVSTS